MLASTFNSGAAIRSDSPLSDDQIRRVAPSVFAEDKHSSRSERYTYIPTIDVLNGLRREGFQPFMACQARVRREDKTEFTKHMLRLRHASQINDQEANEIILINSHDGTSSYQMLAGMFRFVCRNGLVIGDRVGEIRVPHKGNIQERVVQGAYDILEGFDLIREKRDDMRAITLKREEQIGFAAGALALRYSDPQRPAPIIPEQVLQPRRWDDHRDDLWTVFNRVQENLMKGGQLGRNAKGRAVSTRAIRGIDTNVNLNRALWAFASAIIELRDQPISQVLQNVEPVAA